MIGHIVSHYRILQKLGGGGMGVVYKAEDLRLGRTVALKFLAPELTRDEDAKKRFLHEAQAASALDHPNICGIYEIDETPEGQLFIAMTCYEGESLKQRIARRGLDIEEAFQIAFAVAQGLGRAHASNIIHRDIKPGNIMITSDGFVKIIDFGLSKLIGRSRVTGSGATLGTVAYMSPEQARSEEVDARADIWALGAVLYEMLTGQLPFRGEIDQAVVYSILNETQEPIRHLRADVPEVCAAIVNKCLSKDPGERYQSAEEFSVALFEAGKKLGWGDSFAKGGVRAVSVVTERDRRGPRRLAVPLAIAAVVLVAAGPLAWWKWNGSVYSTKVRLAVMPLARPAATPSQAFVDGLSQWISGAFERASRDHPSMWVLSYARVLDDCPADLSRVSRTFGVNRMITGNVQPFEDGQRLTLVLTDAQTLRPIRSTFVEFDPASPDSLQDELAGAITALLDRRVSSAVHARVAGVRPSNSGAFASYLQGAGYAQGKSKDNLDKAEREFDAVIAADSMFAPAFALRGWVRCTRGREPASLAMARNDLETAAKLDSTAVQPWLWLASVCEKEGSSESAVQQLKHALRVDSESNDVRESLGRTYAQLGRFDEADATYHEIVARRPDYYLGHWLLGWLARQVHASDREYVAYRRALDLAPDDWRSVNSMGAYQVDQGNWPMARELFERAFLIQPNCASCSMAGWVLYYEGRFGDAARYYEYALGYCDSTNYKHWGNLACALYWAEGERSKGITAYRRAIELAERQLERTPDDSQAIARLADYYAMIGDRDSAYRMIDRASDMVDTDVAYRLACAHEKLGERNQALDYIGEALRGNFPLREIEVEPLFRDLVKDPRFRPLADAATAGAHEGSSP